MSNNLLNVQQVAFQILAEFDKFCKEHQLTYYISYGTLLGAVRHGGFIPLDDDIDVSMPREDYERLLLIPADKFPDGIKLMHYKNTAEHYLVFAKLVNENTTLIERMGPNSYAVMGVYIDIFPIDGAGNTLKQGARRIKKADLLIKIARWASYSEMKRKDKDESLFKRVVFGIVHALRFIDFYNIVLRYLERKPYSQSEYVASYSGAYKTKEVVPKNFYGIPSKIKFNDLYFNAPENPHGLLEHFYGDYMQLPPEDKRVAHQILYVALNKPYKDFKHEDMQNTNQPD